MKRKILSVGLATLLFAAGGTTLFLLTRTPSVSRVTAETVKQPENSVVTQLERFQADLKGGMEPEQFGAEAKPILTSIMAEMADAAAAADSRSVTKWNNVLEKYGVVLKGLQELWPTAGACRSEQHPSEDFVDCVVSATPAKASDFFAMNVTVLRASLRSDGVKDEPTFRRVMLKRASDMMGDVVMAAR